MGAQAHIASSRMWVCVSSCRSNGFLRIPQVDLGQSKGLRHHGPQRRFFPSLRDTGPSKNHIGVAGLWFAGQSTRLATPGSLRRFDFASVRPRPRHGADLSELETSSPTWIISTYCALMAAASPTNCTEPPGERVSTPFDEKSMDCPGRRSPSHCLKVRLSTLYL